MKCVENSHYINFLSEKRMRILVTGSSFGAKLGMHLVQKTNFSWSVITSFHNSVNDWMKCTNVLKVQLNSQLTEKDVFDANEPLVIEVIALSFFEKTWVKEFIKSAKNLILIVSSPLHLLEKSFFEKSTETGKFNRLLVTKTTSTDKQSQYYTSFVEPTSMTLTEFKKILRALEDQQYVEIQNGLVKIIQWGVDKPKVPNKDTKPQQQLEETKEAPTELKVVEEKKDSERNNEPNKVLLEKSISSTVVPMDMSEFWVMFSPDTSIKDIEYCITAFEDMISNDLLTSMFSTTCKKKTKSHVEFYFHVHKQRQDLFVALMMNILQSLRSNNIISIGSITL